MRTFVSSPQDIAELARLKILGGKLKKRSTARKEPPSAVLSAMQQARQESLASGAADAAAAAAVAAADGAAAGGGGGPLAAPAGAGGWAPPPGVASSSGGAGGWGGGPLPATPVRYAAGPAGAGVLAHLTSLRGAFTGLPFEEDDDATETPLVRGSVLVGAPPCLLLARPGRERGGAAASAAGEHVPCA